MHRNTTRLIVSAIIIIVLDQLSKLLVISTDILPHYLNPYIAYSLQLPWYVPWVLIGVGSVYLLVRYSLAELLGRLEVYLKSVRYGWFGLGLIVGGSFGNLLDRVLRRGAVVDFIDIKIFPVFNLADMSIVLGVLLLLMFSFGRKKRSEMTEPTG